MNSPEISYVFNSFLVATCISLAACSSNSETAANAIFRAKTATEEKEAFTLTNKTTSGFAVRFFDVKGIEIPFRTGNWRESVSITISWPDGRSVTHTLLNPANMYILLRE